MKKSSKKQFQLLHIVLLIFILGLGAFFRFYGINWDQDYHLHPDERFLTMVATSIQTVSTVAEYFNTQQSSLNPHNVLDANGNSIFPFFVYGTLPLFIVRYVGEFLNQTGYGQINIVGRYLSGIFDLGTVVVIYLISVKLFPAKRWIGQIASILYACSVLPIQISHFFIVDNFTTFFATTALYACVRISLAPSQSKYATELPGQRRRLLAEWEGFGDFALFALALGMASASKINSVVIAGMLPVAVIIRNLKLNGEFRFRLSNRDIRGIVLAAIFSFLVFRTFQPYAFSGPGFFHLNLNPRWINNLAELRILSSGDSNFPPSLQWARRSLLFPIHNMIIWGLGIPLGTFSISGFVYMGIKVFQKQWQTYALIWLFTGLYLGWQVSLWNPTMRYFLLIYPFLAIIAAWQLNELAEKMRMKFTEKRKFVIPIGIGVLSIFLIIGTFLWAVAFSNIYRQPMTRIAASEWIYENVEGAVNLRIASDGEEFHQPLPNTHFFPLNQDEMLQIEVKPELSGDLHAIRFDHIVQLNAAEGEKVLLVELIDPQNGMVLASQQLVDIFLADGDSRGKGSEILLDKPLRVQPENNLLLRVQAENADSAMRIFGSIDIGIRVGNLDFSQSVFIASRPITMQEPYIRNFNPIRTGKIVGIDLFRVNQMGGNQSPMEISVQIIDQSQGLMVVDQLQVLEFDQGGDYRGRAAEINFSRPIEVFEGRPYTISISVTDEQEAFVLNGSKTAKETDWDDALPLFMYGLNPFDTYEGVYPSDLNFQMYWDDNQEKLERFLRILYQADYIFITSNRQWGSTTQIEERYPLTTLFYKELIGCPHDHVQNCYRDASPGMFSGRLGFELVKTFQSMPEIFGIEFNSQYAEEAFTVYDHPKVLIFRKGADFDIQLVTQKLDQVNLNQVLNLTPSQADIRPGSLLLSEGQMKAQLASGTWSDFFDRQSWINQNPVLTVVAWYLFLTLLGWMVLPIARLAFYGFPDRGFAFLKPLGLLLLSLCTWLTGSAGLPVTRPLILSILGFLLIANGFLFFREKTDILHEIKQNRNHIILIEIISLFLFLFFLGVRIGNPDLWHPFKGGEKPMDFSYLNAVIKSIHFPPYDPWFSGGYINYYYFGFVLAAIPIKLLGIIPSVGYNLVLAIFFSFTGLAAFGVIWNLSRLRNPNRQDARFGFSPYFLGILGLFFVLIIGNLGTVRMIINGFSRIALVNSYILQGVGNHPFLLFIQGIRLYIAGFDFPYRPGDWYWIPSRAIPGEPITEFPYFTFLYGDPHAHLFAYPYTLLALGWILSLLYTTTIHNHTLTSWIQVFLGACIIGSLLVINTWDLPLLLVLACAVLFISYLKGQTTTREVSPGSYLVLRGILLVGGFLFLINLIYYPFIHWYGQAYTSIRIWDGDKTPLGSYLIHWGFFLYIITSYLILRLYKWMLHTPLAALRPVFQNRRKLYILFLVISSIALVLIILGVHVVMIAFPLALICALLFFLDEKKHHQRIILTMIAIALMLTVFVEIAVLVGDIGRMNTVFKIYLQAWTYFALASALVLPQLHLDLLDVINKKWKKAWAVAFIILMVSVSMFPVNATADKIADRMIANVPLTIDGMEYMRHASYKENEKVMELGQDYQAIRWMQENIPGTPVIIEANVPEYRWGNRYTIYTGLPGVLGWNWHQRQQRAINPASFVFDRLEDINQFYSSPEVDVAKAIIEKYNIQLIIVGQLERAVYPSDGLLKFQEYDQKYWEQIYSDRETQIYRVK